MSIVQVTWNSRLTPSSVSSSTDQVSLFNSWEYSKYSMSVTSGPRIPTRLRASSSSFAVTL